MEQFAAQQKTSIWSNAKPVEGGIRVEVVAGFTGDGSRMERYASRLCHALISAGTPVQTVGGLRAQIAQRKLKSTGRCTTEVSAQSLIEEPPTSTRVIFADAFDFSGVEHSHWYARRMGELRTCQLIWAALTGAQSSILVLDPKRLFWRHQLCAIFLLIGALLRRKSVSVHVLDARVAPFASRLIRARTSEPTQQDADACVLDLGFTEGADPSALRLTPSRAEHAVRLWAMDGNGKHLPEFTQLIDASSALDLRLSAQVRMMRTQPNGAAFRLENEQAQAVEPDAQIGVPITPYMLHLRHALRLQTLFPLEKTREAKRFLNWYVWEAARHVSARWVPIPPAVRDYFLESAWHDCDQPCDAQETGDPFPISPALADFAQAEKFAHLQLTKPAHKLAIACAFVIETRPDADLNAILGPQAIAYLSQQIPGGANAVTRFEFMLAVFTRIPFEILEENSPFWCGESLQHWVQSSVRQILPAADPLLSPEKPASQKPKAFMTGFADSATGIAENLTMSDRAFRQSGIPLTVMNADNGLRADDAVPGSIKLLKSFGLHHINADRVPQTLLTPSIPTNSAFHIGFLLWEFQKLPEAHKLAVEMLDEVWVPSTFVAEAYAAIAPEKTFLMRKGIDLPDVPAADLAKYNIAPNLTTFLVCFDFHSSVSRKNPLAAVRAFVDAFPQNRKDVHLIVKITPATRGHWGDPERQFARIRGLAARDKRITIIEKFISRDALIGLVRAVDCVVSTHRAEGFGLIPGYALAAGIPVIATDYSGTRDFCKPQTAGVLPYVLTRVDPAHMIYPVEGARWAEVDHEATVVQLREFADDDSELRARAECGRDLMQDSFSPKSQAKRYLSRLEALGLIEKT